MLVTDLNTSIRYTLQDTDKRRWKDAELLDYMNEGLRDIALRTFYRRVSEDLVVTSLQSSYTLSKDAIKIHSISTYQLYTIISNDTLVFTDPKDETVGVIYYAYPDVITDTINEEIDIIDSLKYFVLHKCYEKEDSPENFNKAGYFYNKYINYINENMTRWHGDVDVTLSKSDYFA